MSLINDYDKLTPIKSIIGIQELQPVHLIILVSSASILACSLKFWLVHIIFLAFSSKLALCKFMCCKLDLYDHMP